jgi:glycerol-3-phosphate acyltransferase PlsY
MIIKEILTLLSGYLIGAIPFAFIIAYLKNKEDIRQLGTGNAGTMNVAREIGVFSGIMVLALDMAKGCLAILIAKWLGVPSLWVFLTGFAAVAGHSWSPFLKFRGGKGVATALGVLLGLTPLEFIIGFAVMVSIFMFTRNSGLSAGIGFVILPPIIGAFGNEISLVLYPLAIALFTGLRNLIGLKPHQVKENTDPNSFFRIYPAFWRKHKS